MLQRMLHAYFSILKMTAICYSERSIEFRGLHLIETLEIEFFITADVRNKVNYIFKTKEFKKF
jgi:hypothetical protein